MRCPPVIPNSPFCPSAITIDTESWLLLFKPLKRQLSCVNKIILAANVGVMNFSKQVVGFLSIWTHAILNVLCRFFMNVIYSMKYYVQPFITWILRNALSKPASLTLTDVKCWKGYSFMRDAVGCKRGMPYQVSMALIVHLPAYSKQLRRVPR